MKQKRGLGRLRLLGFGQRWVQLVMVTLPCLNPAAVAATAVAAIVVVLPGMPRTEATGLAMAVKVKETLGVETRAAAHHWTTGASWVRDGQSVAAMGVDSPGD
jgi:hypothetical protein